MRLTCLLTTALVAQACGPSHHPDGWERPENHGRSFAAHDEDCRLCHGDELRGDFATSCDGCHDNGWRRDCAFCHADPSLAPAPALFVDPSRFDHHVVHLTDRGFHAPLDCDDCHRDVEDVLDDAHVLDATPAQVEVDLDDGGRFDPETGACTDSWCHGDGRGANGRVTTDARDIGCGGCHPDERSGRAAWARMTPPHERHLKKGLRCGACHGAVIDPDGVPADRGLHLDHEIDVTLAVPTMRRQGGLCTGVCHGEVHKQRLWRDPP